MPDEATPRQDEHRLIRVYLHSDQMVHLINKRWGSDGLPPFGDAVARTTLAILWVAKNRERSADHTYHVRVLNTLLSLLDSFQFQLQPR
jgi:hypothetical protein